MPESISPEPVETLDPCDAGAHDGGRVGTGSPAGWLSQVMDVLLLGQTPDVAVPPMTVLHAWHAASISPLLIEAFARDGRDTGIQHAVQELHSRAAQGESISANAWRVALEPALREVYRRAYDGEQAFATASAAAAAFALSRGYSESDAAEYGRTYGEMNTEANLSAFADANALAASMLLSQSFAAADPAAYARTYPAAYIRACLSACTENAGDCEQIRTVLADGLVRALADATVTTAAAA
jgi:hypothetical protein